MVYAAKVLTSPPPPPVDQFDTRGTINLITISLTGPPTALSGAEDALIASIGQFQKALGAAQLNDVVYQSLSADLNDPNFIQYSKGLTVVFGDSLCLAVQAIIGYSDAQMEALFANAVTQSL